MASLAFSILSLGNGRLAAWIIAAGLVCWSALFLRKHIVGLLLMLYRYFIQQN